jgi:hypothetical protein
LFTGVTRTRLLHVRKVSDVILNQVGRYDSTGRLEGRFRMERDDQNLPTDVDIEICGIQQDVFVGEGELV